MNKTTLYLAHKMMRRFSLLFILQCFFSVAKAASLTMESEVHSFVAVISAIIFVGALVLAVVLWLQTRRLHHLNPKPSFLDHLPPVLVLEKLLFRLLWLGFVFLTLLVVSGMWFGEDVWGRALVFKHKVVFTLVAWFVFATLLAGHYFKGWRGLRVVKATIIGFTLLFLAYVGTHFVLDVLLKNG